MTTCYLHGTKFSLRCPDCEKADLLREQIRISENTNYYLPDNPKERAIFTLNHLSASYLTLLGLLLFFRLKILAITVTIIFFIVVGKIIWKVFLKSEESNT